MDSESYEYDAFISYRHVEPDRSYAKWLHKALETYKVPKDLVTQGYPARIGKIFRDEEELPASSDLSKEINLALKKSRFLIVVCSPRIVQSVWCNAEVELFKEFGKQDKIMALLIEGSPSESFPASLCQIKRPIVQEDGTINEKIETVEPLAADVRPRPHESQRNLKQLARLRLIASILGCKFDELRQREQCRQRQRLTAVGIVAAILLFTLSALTLWATTQQRVAERHWEIALQERKMALEQQKIAELKSLEAIKLKENAEKLLYFSNIQLAEEEYTEKNIVNGDRLLKSCPPQYRHWEWYHLWNQNHNFSQTFTASERDLYCLAVSPDGTQVATGGRDKTIKVWDIKTGKTLSIFKEHKSFIKDILFSAAGNNIISAEKDKMIKIWEVKSGKLIHSWKAHKGNINSLALGLNGQQLISAGDDKAIKVWDIKTGKLIHSLKGHSAAIRSAIYDPVHGRIISGSDDKTVKVWDAETGKLIHTLKGHTRSVTSVSINPQGSLIASASKDKTVRTWNAVTGSLETIFRGHKKMIHCVTFCPQGEFLLSGSGDYLATEGSSAEANKGIVINAWNVKSGQLHKELKGHTRDIVDLVFNPATHKLFSAARDKTIKIWDLTLNPIEYVQKSTNYKIKHLFVSPQGYKVTTVDNKKNVEVWDIKTGKRTNLSIKQSLSRLAFSPDNTLMASASQGKAITIYDAKTLRVIHSLNGHRSLVNHLAFSPDSQFLISAARDKTVKMWNMQDGKLIRTMKGHSKSVNSACFSPDGKKIVSGGGHKDRTVKIWDAESGRLIRTIQGHEESVNSVCFSPNGTKIISASGDPESPKKDNSIKIWNAASGELIQTLEGHVDAVLNVRYSPDGLRIISTSKDRTVKIWDAESGRLILTLEQNSDYILSQGFKAVLPTDYQVISLW